MENLTIINAGSLMAIVIGVVQLLKMSGISSRYLPLLALAVGVGASMLFFGVTGNAILQGVIMALSSMGIYSGTKATAGN